MKLAPIIGFRTNPVQQNNIIFGGALSRKNVSELTKATELRQKLTECQQTLRSLEGTTSDPEFKAVLALTELRLAELKAQLKSGLSTVTRIVN